MTVEGQSAVARKDVAAGTVLDVTAVLAELMRGLDLSGLERCRANWRAEAPDDEDDWKYFNVERNLRKLLFDFCRLRLHESPPPLRILDLGTGPGYFAHLCRHFGHHCIGLELPLRPRYRDLQDWVGATVIEHRILPLQPLPKFEHRFDLVTAFHLQFNAARDAEGARRLFNLQEWSYFLDDLRDNTLAPGGDLWLRFNRRYKTPGLTFGDPELMALFAERGGKVPTEGSGVHFAPLR